MTPHAASSILALSTGFVFLVFFAARYVRARLVAADVSLLDRMREQGILIGEPARDYRTLSYLLDTIAPVVSMRKEIWVSVYAVVLLLSRLLLVKDWFARQMRLLAAHQAVRYASALDRLAELRAAPIP